MGINMKNTVILAAAMLLTCSIAGCGRSPTPRFYVLNSVKTVTESEREPRSTGPVVIAIGPVTIPDYMDRPQIVTRIGQNQLTVNEFDRWGGSLKDDIVRVLMENLSEMLREDGISVISWKRSVPAEARVTINITRLDIAPGSNVLLKAQWMVFPKDGPGAIVTREATITEPEAGGNFNSATATASRVLENLARQVAADISKLAGKHELSDLFQIH